MKFPINRLLISFINILEVAGVASAEEEGTGAVDPSVAAAAGEVTAAVEASRGAVTAALAPVTRATRRAAAVAAVDMEAIAAAVEEKDTADQAPVENGKNYREDCSYNPWCILSFCRKRAFLGRLWPFRIRSIHS